MVQCAHGSVVAICDDGFSAGPKSSAPGSSFTRAACSMATTRSLLAFLQAFLCPGLLIQVGLERRGNRFYLPVCRLHRNKRCKFTKRPVGTRGYNIAHHDSPHKRQTLGRRHIVPAGQGRIGCTRAGGPPRTYLGMQTLLLFNKCD